MTIKQKVRRLAAAVLFLAGCVLSAPVLAAAEALVPMGTLVGIQMNTEGVLIASTPAVETAQGERCPAEEAGLRPGDRILALNGRDIRTAAELSAAAAELGDEPVTVTADRNGELLQLTLQPVRDREGVPRLGLWLRDGIAGVGTVTYYDPDTGKFGALGHGINDVDSGLLMPLGTGSVCRATVVDVTKGLAGTPGALAGRFDMAGRIGTIEANTTCGIFGIMSLPAEGLGQALPLAEADEVKNGPATILSTVDGGGVQSFDVQLSRSPAGELLNLRVTDPELLALTGGIVQGMSGSPIIQDGKLVGAVTHVLVNDPTRGYGIFIENMLDAAG